ncbi:M13 family metallopeptidase [Tsuneonella flava]|uniref:M13 family metallopeptidase n=1 Tax=Tsuneonella flava TaxID=2055955 RepID=A0ABX7K9B4_9SPHN|nr:M13 family metallopeptidase [Tsuneonella flava]QSB43837.1 M13 family metallopeptidase [Tsuneonella flava]
MNTRLIAALLLGTTTATLGPVGCKMSAEQPAEPKSTTGEIGIRTDWMDTKAKPGDDWYRYVDGKWMETTTIPADRSSVGGFTIASEQTEKNLAELIADIEKSKPDGDSDMGRVKTFYDSLLDTKSIDAAGMRPAETDVARFDAITDKQALSEVLGSQVRADVDPLNATNFWTENLFGLFVTQALKGGEVVPYILQGGLGMPEREYYLSSDPKMASLRQDYRKYIANLLDAAHIDDAEAKAQRIYKLELKIAAAHASREDSEDWAKASDIWTQDDFKTNAPGIDWDAFFQGARLAPFDSFDAYHPTAIARISALVASEPLDAWKDWLVFHQINSSTEALPTQLDQLHFEFYGQKLSGAEKQRPRDKRVLEAVNTYLGDALGKLYVEKFFPASSKAEIEGMVKNIKQAFAERIGKLDWMAPETRQEAEKKVKGIVVGVGYPDKWTDYSSLNLKAGEPYYNLQAARRLRYAQQLAKIGKPQDRGEWWMNAQLVNAVNLPVQNALNFPAAILQPPFFDPNADPAYNYGAIGAVIGHEISHSFDNNGAAFDSTGAMRNWWTDADKAKFAEAGRALAAQYDQYSPYPGLHVNGKLTLGENIADVAGLQAAYQAYRKSLGGKEAPTIDGFTGDQRFFIAFGQTWATKMREAAMRQRIATDGHAPGQYRALTVRNLEAWYKAFDIKPGDKLYLSPEKRVTVW